MVFAFRDIRQYAVRLRSVFSIEEDTNKNSEKIFFTKSCFLFLVSCFWLLCKEKIWIY